MNSLFDYLNRAMQEATNQGGIYSDPSKQFSKQWGPDGMLHDEAEMYEEIKKSDLDRLRRLG